MTTKIEVRKSLTIYAPASKVWDIVISPALMRKWMLVTPEFEGVPLAIGSKVKWVEDGTPYLVGTVTAFEPCRRLSLALADVSWKREARPGEVAYTMTLAGKDDMTEIEFTLGDLSIDANAPAWRDAYAASRELETIKEMAETK